MEPYYLTTPIYYVNSTPHIGHAYTTVAADVFARHQRQRGRETFLLTGVDEHASKVARVAEEQGLAPQEYVDRIADAWRALPARLGVANDFFIRTSDEGHKRFVQEFLERIRSNGRDDVYQDVYAGLYCVGCEAFKTEEELVDGKCPEHDVEPEWIEERNWFFRLSAYQEQLLALYDERPDFVLPGFRANEARTFIAGGLQDFSISRAGQPWGIPIPWDPEQVAYVWADALVNYLSALTYARPGEDLVDRFWPAAHHLLAKDILRFHCVYWPAMLLAAGYEPPQQLFVHGYLLSGDRKVSKSLGNLVADPLDLLDVYGADAIRFWCARSVSFGQDGIASVEGVRERYERELGNDLGNLLSRVTAMVARYRDGDLAAVPSDDSAVAPILEPLAADVARAARRLRPDGCARADLGGRAGPQPARRGDRPVAAREGRGARGRARSRPLRPRRRAPRGRDRSRRLPPGDRRRILEALGQPAELDWDGVAYGRTRAVQGLEAAPPLFPRVDEPAPGGVIDTHAHLDGCDAEPGELLERAEAVGVTRVITIGTGIESCRRALSIAEEHTGVVAALGIDPHQAASPDAARVEELRELLDHPRAVAVGETGLDGHHGAETLREQRKLFDAQLALADELGSPSSSTAARRARRRPRRSRRSAARSILHCFSEPDLLEPALERGYYVSFAGNVTYPRAEALRAAAARVPSDRLLAETDSPYLAPQPVRGRPNEPAHVRHTLAALALARGETSRRARGPDRRERDGRLRARPGMRSVAAEALARSALPRRPERPRRHRAPRAARADRRRARDRPGARRAHDVPRGPRAARPCGRARHGRSSRRSETRSGRERTSTCTSPTPSPSTPKRSSRRRPSSSRTCPYNVGTPIVAETLLGAPTLGSWCVMVQREVADRFFAEPGTKAYGAVSVLVRLHAVRTGFHPVARTVLSPGAERRLGARRLRADPGAAGRREQSAGSSAARSRTVGRRSRTLSRSPASRVASRSWRRSTRSTGGPTSAPRRSRPRSSSRSPLRSRDERLARGCGAGKAELDARRRPAPGRREARGRHRARAARAGRRGCPARGRRDGRRRVRRRHARRRGARGDLRRGRDATTVRGAPDQASPGRSGARGRLERRGDDARARQPGTWPGRALGRRLHDLAAELGADVPFFLQDGPQLATGDGTTLEPLELPRDYSVLLVLRVGDEKSSTRDVYAAFDAREGARDFDRRRHALRGAVARIRSAGDLADLPPNDLASSPLAAELRELGAFRADVSGAGPVVYGLFETDAEAERAGEALAGRARVWVTAPIGRQR